MNMNNEELINTIKNQPEIIEQIKDNYTTEELIELLYQVKNIQNDKFLKKIIANKTRDQIVDMFYKTSFNV